MKREDVIQTALTWSEVPWRHQGRTRRGIDCAGLVLNVGNDLGLMDYHVNNYPRNTNRDHFVNHFHNFGTKKQLKDRQRGDMILFRDGIYACHCGILDTDKHGNEYVIHAYQVRGKTIREPLTGELLIKLTHCFSYRGLEDG